MSFALQSIFVRTLEGFLTWCNVFQRGADGFTSPLKEVVLWILIACKNPLSLARFEHANLRSSGKHVINRLLRATSTIIGDRKICPC
jgi:hypothetical protein